MFIKMKKGDVSRSMEDFAELIEEQLVRVARLKETATPIDYKSLKPIIIGVVGGDGIGPAITRASRDVLEFLLDSSV